VVDAKKHRDDTNNSERNGWFHHPSSTSDLCRRDWRVRNAARDVPDTAFRSKQFHWDGMWKKSCRPINTSKMRIFSRWTSTLDCQFLFYSHTRMRIKKIARYQSFLSLIGNLNPHWKITFQLSLPCQKKAERRVYVKIQSFLFVACI
jgi:hypothetical protein